MKWDLKMVMKAGMTSDVKKSMTIGSLFTGIGGIEIGLRAAGVGKTVWQVEKDPFCRAVLEKHWPDARRYEDVCEVGKHNLEPVDVIAGGFPCQDVSVAGLGAGLKGARSGLWFEYARIVEELKPRFVVVENVAALVRRGLDEVLKSLAALRYDAEWSTLRASDVGRILGDDRYGARHRRERLFLIAWRRHAVADANHGRRLGRAENLHQANGRHESANSRHTNQELADAATCRLRRVGPPGQARQLGRSGTLLADADGQQCQGQGHEPDGVHAPHARPVGSRAGEPRGGLVERPAQAPLGGVGVAAHGLLPRLDVARPGEEQKPWEAPRTVVEQQDRAKRLRALGNAVVPAAAYVVGMRLLEIQRALDEGREL